MRFILPPPLCTASIVENLNNRIASSTCSSVATGDNVIFANDSEIRIIASSCLQVMSMSDLVSVGQQTTLDTYLMVIGMDDLTWVSFSVCFTSFLIPTKWLLNLPAASAVNLGAHLL
jgi:hypothetical protein